MASPEVPDMPAARVRVVVPTYNGGAVWRAGAQALARCVARHPGRYEVLVVDSSSRDDSVQVARQHGFAVQVIAQQQFDHGATRNLACQGSTAQCVVFLTQDAILQDDTALEALVAALDDPAVAVAYGRQLPHEGANPIAAHARLFNYPERGYVSSLADRNTLGLKAVFSSNSFAVYRLSVLRELGGFPERVILSEDMHLAARAVMAGHKLAYAAQAAVRHSHNYTPLQEFRRYFDIGVFHTEQAWIARTFGGAGGEGRRFLASELRYLARRAPGWLPRAWLHDALKILGYKLGKQHRHLPAAWRRALGMNKTYWEERRA